MPKLFNERKVIARAVFGSQKLTQLLKCLTIYSLFFLLGTAITWFFINQFDLLPTNLENARYIVSILIQSQAAILSIVVTLTLIAIQLTASIYSPRVVDVLRKNPDLWLLVIIYVTLIGVELIFLKVLGGTVVLSSVDGNAYLGYIVNGNPGLFGYSQETILTLLLGAGISSIAILGPYTLNTLNVMRSENVISKLISELDSENIFSNENGSLQPFFDVINSALLRYDVTTSRTGLKKIVARVISLSEGLENDERKQVSQDFCKHLYRCYIVTDRLNDQEMGIEVIKSLREFGVASVTWRDEHLTEFVLFSSLEPIGQIIISKKLSESMLAVTNALTEIGKAASENNQGCLASMACCILSNLALDSADSRFPDYFQNLPDTIEQICKVALDNSLLYPIHSANSRLRSCAEKAIESDIDDHDISMIIGSLGNIGRKSVEKAAEHNDSDFPSPINEIVNSLAQLGKAAASKHLSKSMEKSAATLCAIGAELFENGQKDDANRVITHLIELTEMDPKNAFTGVCKVQDEWSCGQRESFSEFINPYWIECRRNPLIQGR